MESDLHLARALVVERDAALCHEQAQQLHALGVGQVSESHGVRDARLTLEREYFDIVVCSREFGAGEDSGQDLLDELRRERLLPYSTVFMMVSDRPPYHQVVEAAEAALDGILVRPFGTPALGQRLAEARQRKRELADVLRALDAGEAEAALSHALRRFSQRAPYWVYCGRVAAELLLVLKRADAAAKLFAKLVQERPVAWTRLGLARAHFAAGDVLGARRELQLLLQQEPHNADAHDLLGRIHVEQCEFDDALTAYRQSSALTPGCLLRQQHAGGLAFYQGQGDEALRHFESALAMGVKSRLFDALSLLMMAMLRFDRGDLMGLAAARDHLRRFRERYPGSARLERMLWCADALLNARSQGMEAAAPLLLAVCEQAARDDFDLEGAAMLLALLRRLHGAFSHARSHERLVQDLGRRFATSKAITEMLVAAAGRASAAAVLLQSSYAEVSGAAESAMERVMHGAASEAVSDLLDKGESWRNTRLLELAHSLIRRHADQLRDPETAAELAQALIQRFGRALNHIAGIQRSGRAPGAMHLRGVKPVAAAPTTVKSAAALSA